MPERTTFAPIRRILQLFTDRKREVFFLLFLTTVAAGLDITVPFISQKLIDFLINYFKTGAGSPLHILFFAAAGILVATVVSQVINSTYGYRLFTLVTQKEDELRNRAFEKYLRLHTLFHHGSSSGQIIGRLDRGATAVFAITYDILGHNLIQPLVLFVGVFIALAAKNIWIALAVVTPFPIYLFAIKKISERIYEIEQKSNEQFEEISKESYDVAANVLTVKKFSQEKVETEKNSVLLARFRHTQYGAERLWALIENIQSVIATIGRMSVIVLAGIFVLRGKATIGEFVLYITLQNMAYAPLWRLSYLLPRLRRNVSRVERLFHLIDEPIRVTDKSDAIALPPLKKEIRFQNVHFRYSENGRLALKNINVVILARSTVALVGRSGSGKTTFINLLLRSFDPDRGALLIDGKDLRNVTQKSLRDQIAVVPQEVDLFSRTIGENIAYGQPRASAQEIAQAAKTALAHPFIVKMEKGYGTLVGERGIKLSGGERQRVGIARAILKNPSILILDEATSHLDTESERLIREATRSLIRDRTTIIIAHRLSTILGADVILVFNQGELEAQGSHAELLKKSPTYRRLYKMQFAGM